MKRFFDTEFFLALRETSQRGIGEKSAATYLRKAIQLTDRQIEWTEKRLPAEQNAANCPLAAVRQTRKPLKWSEP